MFLAASLLLDQPTLVADNCDQWSLAYADAFLVGLVPADAPLVSAFFSVDPINLLLARASLLREEGAIYVALSEYSKAISRLLPPQLPTTYRRYRGYKIVRDETLFYAVPESIGDFSIFHGTVIRVPNLVKKTVPRLRSRFLARLSAPQGARLKTFLRFTKTRIAPQVARIPGMRFAARRVRRLVLTMYTQRYAVSGVLSDGDVSLLHERIDSSEHHARPQADRMATRETTSSG
jgi:hypothetical protein